MNSYINALTHEQKLAVIKECNRLARGGKPKNQWGLCRNLEKAAGVNGYRIVSLLSSTWKHHSGNSCFPVAGGDFYTLGVKNELWHGEQGELRRSLARHIAKKLKETL